MLYCFTLSDFKSSFLTLTLTLDFSENNIIFGLSMQITRTVIVGESTRIINYLLQLEHKHILYIIHQVPDIAIFPVSI